MKNFEKKFGETYLKIKMYEFIFGSVAMVFIGVIFLLSRCGGKSEGSHSSSSGSSMFENSLSAPLVEDPEYVNYFSGCIVFSDEDGFYLANNEGEIRTRLYNKQVYDFGANRGWVYYSEPTENKVYATRLSQRETVEIADTYGYEFKFTDNYLYYLHEEGINQVSLYDMEHKTIIEGSGIYDFEVEGEWIIYSNNIGEINRFNLAEDYIEINPAEYRDYGFLSSSEFLYLPDRDDMYEVIVIE